MKLGIICGSHRNESQSEKVARYIERTLLEEGHCEDTWLFSLAGNPLPLWEEGIWEGDPGWQERMGPLSEQLASCDGFVIVSPEWHGMVPAGLKNFFLIWTGGGELAHKPALIVTVSVADGGYQRGAVGQMPSGACRLGDLEASVEFRFYALVRCSHARRVRQIGAEMEEFLIAVRAQSAHDEGEFSRARNTM